MDVISWLNSWTVLFSRCEIYFGNTKYYMYSDVTKVMGLGGSEEEMRLEGRATRTQERSCSVFSNELKVKRIFT